MEGKRVRNAPSTNPVADPPASTAVDKEGAAEGICSAKSRSEMTASIGHRFNSARKAPRKADSSFSLHKDISYHSVLHNYGLYLFILDWLMWGRTVSHHNNHITQNAPCTSLLCMQDSVRVHKIVLCQRINSFVLMIMNSGSLLKTSENAAFDSIRPGHRQSEPTMSLLPDYRTP